MDKSTNAVAYAPGYYIRDILTTLNISYNDFAQKMDMNLDEVTQLILGECELTEEIAKKLDFETCNLQVDDFINHVKDYFGMAYSLNGPTANIDCWLDAAGAKSILDDFLKLGKIESRFVSVAVNKEPRSINLLHMTYAQQSIIGSGGYMKEDVDDVQEIMACGKWNLESMITHEFPLEQLDQALYKASDVNNSLNVIIKMKK